MTALSFRNARRKLSESGLLPQTMLSRLFVTLAVLDVILYAAGRLSSTVGSANPLGTSITFVTFLLIVVGVFVLLRWVRENLMWRLRNRLIVTYVFIGVIPVVLLAAMAVMAGWLFASQFSTFVVTSDLQAEIGKLHASNEAIGARMAQLAKLGYFDAPVTPALVNLDSSALQNRHITAWYRGKALVLRDPGNQNIALAAPETIKNDNIVIDDGKLYLRAVTRVAVPGNAPNDDVVIVSSVALDQAKLEETARGLGVVELYRPTNGHSTQDYSSSLNLTKIGSFETMPAVSAGTLPPGVNRFDFLPWPFLTFVDAFDWTNGKPDNVLVRVTTRPSLLYSRLFRTLGQLTSIIANVLYAVAIFFALIELLALIIGLRLTRTMTKSVASLYDATQLVNQGDFSHRIKVTSRDQLAALETSFNSMTESLQRLIAEQKEKQRIESELAIAQEVQALLFPRDITEVESLEVHGVCKPARTVSGDYYDFLPIGPDRLGLAVGDIAGKGISAALLMATVHAFVRAYTLVETVPALSAPAAVGGSSTISRSGTAQRANHDYGDLPPGTLLAMLNQQLYRSTPMEKYATMFLGFYDQTSRRLIYSNAGHLPPLLISTDGTVQSLETGGMVVGLFGDVAYPDDAVEMRPGDIFVAYSDGITEPENEFGEFGEARLIQIVQENRHLPLARIGDEVIAAVQDWIGGAEQPDDLTLVLARAR